MEFDPAIHRFFQHSDSRHRINGDFHETNSGDCSENRHRLSRVRVLLIRLRFQTTVRLGSWH